MKTFTAYLQQIEHPQHRARTEAVLDWVSRTFPDFERRIAWNQPMFIDHGTFILGFSVSAKHLAVSPERAGMEHFSKQIAEAGYGQSKMLFRIRWDEDVNYHLLHSIITFNRNQKAECKTFWRGQP